MDTLQQQRAKLKPVQTSKLAALPCICAAGLCCSPCTAPQWDCSPERGSVLAALPCLLLEQVGCCNRLYAVHVCRLSVQTLPWCIHQLLSMQPSILLRAYNMIQIRMAACCAKITLFPRCFVATSPMSCRVPAMFDLCSAFRCLMCLFSMLALHCCMQLLCAVKVLVCLTSFTQLK